MNTMGLLTTLLFMASGFNTSTQKTDAHVSTLHHTHSSEAFKTKVLCKRVEILRSGQSQLSLLKPAAMQFLSSLWSLPSLCIHCGLRK